MAGKDNMNNKSNWYDGIAKQINQLKATLSEKNYKKYKLNYDLSKKHS